MSAENLLDRVQYREILKEDEIFKEIHELKAHNEPKLAQLSMQYHPADEVRAILSGVIGQEIADSVTVSLPFYSDFGSHIRLGEDIFLNQNVTFVDLGGITLEDHVLIGPGCRLISVNHLLEPEKRRGLQLKPILIKENAWLGANVTVLPGVTIGKNAVVGADSTVTKDVPDNAVVVGSPAKVIKTI